MAPYFYHFLQERYAEAYQEALAFQISQLFWDPLLRAAALGRLGREQEAAQAVGSYSNCGRISPPVDPRYLKFDYLTDAIMDCLRQAGLMI